MRSLFLVFILVFTIPESKCQEKGLVPMLISVSAKGSVHYLDSLLKLKGNRYKVDSLTAADGELVITCDFPIAELDFYHCSSVMLLFMGEPQKEVCVKQIILGRLKDAYYYVSFVKKAFKPVEGKTGVWEMDYIDSPLLKIVATYTIKDDGFVLDYELVEK